MVGTGQGSYRGKIWASGTVKDSVFSECASMVLRLKPDMSGVDELLQGSLSVFFSVVRKV
jgi:hypothetical protein